MIEKSLAVFEDYNIRRVYDEKSENWYFFCSGHYTNSKIIRWQEITGKFLKTALVKKDVSRLQNVTS